MISPGVGESYADGVAAIYRDAELRILNRITTSLEQGIDAPGWEQLQLARLQQVRDAALAELQASNPAAAAQIRDSIEATYNDGVASPYRDLGLTLDPLAGATMQRRAAVDALSADVVNGLASAQPAILRQVDDVYRSVIADATASVLAGGEGRKEATQRALNNLLSRGLDGVPTARGTISLPNYATMAVRTATARAAIDGHTASMGDIGLDLVVVRPGPRACSLCDAWAGKILTRKSTYSNPVYVQSVTDPDKTYTVQVYGTLSGAREAGWGHPNCRCGIAAYMPGTAASENLQRPSYNREEYEAQQHQRALERQIRAWKQREAIALTPEAKADSAAKVQAWQQQMRDHLDAHPYLKRQSSREQITGTLSGNAAAAKAPPRPTTSMPSKPSTKPKQPGAVALTASTTPQLDKLRTFETQPTFKDAQIGANPLYLKGKGDEEYKTNCTHVAVTMEMRARGYDVSAKRMPGAKGQPTLNVLNGGFLKPDGSPITQNDVWPPTTMKMVRGRAVVENSTSAAKALAEIQSWPDGARGFVWFKYPRTRSGHVFNVERYDGDKIRIIEGQTNDGSHDNYFSKGVATSNSFRLMRTDNLILKDAAADYVEELDLTEVAKLTAGVEAKAAANLARKQAIDTEIAGLRARQTEIKAVFFESTEDEAARLHDEFTRIGQKITELQLEQWRIR